MLCAFAVQKKIEENKNRFTENCCLRWWLGVMVLGMQHNNKRKSTDTQNFSIHMCVYVCVLFIFFLLSSASSISFTLAQKKKQEKKEKKTQNGIRSNSRCDKVLMECCMLCVWDCVYLGQFFGFVAAYEKCVQFNRKTNARLVSTSSPATRFYFHSIFVCVFFSSFFSSVDNILVDTIHNVVVVQHQKQKYKIFVPVCVELSIHQKLSKHLKLIFFLSWHFSLRILCIVCYSLSSAGCVFFFSLSLYGINENCTSTVWMGLYEPATFCSTFFFFVQYYFGNRLNSNGKCFKINKPISNQSEILVGTSNAQWSKAIWFRYVVCRACVLN